MEELLKWAKNEGAEFDALDICGRSFIANRDIKGGERFLRTPQRLLLTSELAFKDDYAFQPAFAALQRDVGPPKDSRYILVLLILLERARGNASFWAPYINILPKEYDDPGWWSPEDVKLLEGTRLGTGAERLRDSIQDLRNIRDSFIQHCRGIMGQELDFEWMQTAESITWARSTVWSRAFNVRLQDSEDGMSICLCPLSDMLDHQQSRHVAWHTGPTGREDFQFITFTPVSKGSAVYSNYGNKSNEELILGYGFDLKSNSADFFHVSLGQGSQAQDHGEDCRRWQSQALGQRIGIPQDHYLRVGYPLPSSLVAAASVHMMPDCLLQELLAHPTLITDRNENETNSDERGYKRQRLNAAESPPSPGDVAEMCRIEVGASSSAKETTKEDVTANPRLPVPPMTQLKVLGLLRQQLIKKREEMSGNSADEDKALSGSATTQHAKLALSYRAAQKHIIAESLQVIEQEMSAVLLKASQAAIAAGLERFAALASGSRSFPGVHFSPATAYRMESCNISHGAFCNMSHELCSSKIKVETIIGRPPGTTGVQSLEITQDLEAGQQLAACSASGMLMAEDESSLIKELVSWAATDTSADSGPHEDLFQECLRNISLPLSMDAADPRLEGLPLALDLEQELEELQEEFACFTGVATKAWGGWTPHQQFAVYSWAHHVVDRLSILCPKGLALVPSLGCLQEFIGSVVSISWSTNGDRLGAVVTLNCPAKRGTLLSDTIAAIGQPASQIIGKFGLHIFARLQKAQAGAISLERDLGGRWLQMDYEIGLEASPDDPFAPLKQQLLQASALGTTQHLSQHTGTARVLAAVAIICCSESRLTAAGCQDLLQTFQQAQATGPRMEAAAGPENCCNASDRTPEANLDRAQIGFIAKLLDNKKTVKEARKALKTILDNAKTALKESKGTGAAGEDEIWDCVYAYKAGLQETLSKLRKL